jgi:hypothetical protein
MTKKKNTGVVTRIEPPLVFVDYKGEEVVVSLGLYVEVGDQVSLAGLKITPNRAWAKTYQITPSGMSLNQFKHYGSTISKLNLDNVHTICVYDISNFYENSSYGHTIISIGIGTDEDLAKLEKILKQDSPMPREKEVLFSHFNSSKEKIIVNIFYLSEPVKQQSGNRNGTLFIPVNQLSHILDCQRTWNGELSEKVEQYFLPFKEALQINNSF